MQGCSLLPLLFNIVLVVLANAIGQEREISVQTENEEIKLCSQMKWYLEGNPKEKPHLWN